MNIRISILAAGMLLATQAYASTHKSTINQLLKSDNSVECSFVTQEMGQQKGTFYISGKNMRGDFALTNSNSQPTIAHTLQKGDWVYMWGGPGREKQGTKFKVSEAQKTNPSRTTPGLDLNQEVDIDCKAWKPQTEKFTPPSEVTFQDITGSLQTQGPHGTAAPTGGNECSACNQAPPQSQGQCRQTLGCQ